MISSLMNKKSEVYNLGFFIHYYRFCYMIYFNIYILYLLV